MSVLGLNNTTITLETFNSIGWDTDPSYNAAVSYPAYVELKAVEVMNQTNQKVTSYALIIINQVVGYQDRITLADGIVRNVLKSNGFTYPGGAFSHSEVYV